ncbi:MAG: hypothetical protein IKR41_11035 [Bacteroidales bacterium]|nr:hypothetical protein [Bacteroidales bacterium]
MAEETENQFKENFNWQKITIDAVNTIIATAIGIIIGLLVDKWRENISNEENYQKIIVATINNLENYEKQISNIQTQWIQYCEEGFENIESDDYEETDSSLNEITDLFFWEDFMQQDRWIEENFINNGGFIEDTDLRLKIGNVYSLVDLCKNNIVKLRNSTEKAYDRYLYYFINEKPENAFSKLINDKDLINYRETVREVYYNLDEYITIIKDLNAEIIKKSNADEKALNEQRESSKKILEIINKARQ